MEYAFNRLKAKLDCNRTKVHSTKAWEPESRLSVTNTKLNSTPVA